MKPQAPDSPQGCIKGWYWANPRQTSIKASKVLAISTPSGEVAQVLLFLVSEVWSQILRISRAGKKKIL